MPREIKFVIEIIRPDRADLPYIKEFMDVMTQSGPVHVNPAGQRFLRQARAPPTLAGNMQKAIPAHTGGRSRPGRPSLDLKVLLTVLDSTGWHVESACRELKKLGLAGSESAIYRTLKRHGILPRGVRRIQGKGRR